VNFSEAMRTDGLSGFGKLQAAKAQKKLWHQKRPIQWPF
jgi:hypothetical protein